jgi:L-fuculose-phosphate aldolase
MQRIYELHADIGAVMIAHPPNVMAFAVSDAVFDSRTISESYIVLRDVPELPYGSPFLRVEEMAASLGTRTPVVLVENDCVLTVGANLLQAYDRLEVAEFSAKALIASRSLGSLAPISEAQVHELVRAFKLAE